MKAVTLRTFIAVHTWAGLIAGFGLFIAFYAGAITVFVHELQEWEQSAKPHRPVDSVENAQRLVDLVLARHPEAHDRFNLQVPSSHHPELLLRWDDHEFQLTPELQLAEIKPSSELAGLIYRLHYTAGIPTPWGLYALGFVCILYGLALVTGIVIYTPVFLKDLFALRVGRNLKRLWQDAHNAIGVLSLPFHVIFAWTGAILAIGTLLLAPFQYLVFEGKLMQLIGADLTLAEPREPAGSNAPLLSVSQVLARAQAARPGIEAESLVYHHAGDANAQIDIYGHVEQRSLSALAAIALNGSSGELIRIVDAERFSVGTRFYRSLAALHFGDFGEAPVKWLYFILGMAGAFLFYSGNLLWIETRRERRSVLQPRNTRWMAQATLGVCLGCIAGISAIFLANKLLPAALADRPVWEERVYFLVFFLCLIWAFARPPARGGYELLLTSAVLTGAIPFVNALVTGNHIVNTLIHGEWALFFVDVIALLFAWMFWRMARATLKRGRNGEANSVWSLSPAGGTTSAS